MMTMDKCENCGYKGFMKTYVKFFKISCSQYNFHYGSECPQCGKWQKWIRQTDEITKSKFYEQSGIKAEDNKQDELPLP